METDWGRIAGKLGTDCGQIGLRKKGWEKMRTEWRQTGDGLRANWGRIGEGLGKDWGRLGDTLTLLCRKLTDFCTDFSLLQWRCFANGRGKWKQKFSCFFLYNLEISFYWFIQLLHKMLQILPFQFIGLKPIKLISHHFRSVNRGSASPSAVCIPLSPIS